MEQSQFCIVLVEPARAANVGAVARAMKTTGFTQLRIVNSQSHLEEEANWVAHGATELLEQAVVYPTLDTALEGIDFSIATTARKRGAARSYWTPRDVAEHLQLSQFSKPNVAIVFGRESSGLSNDELARCDCWSYMPLVQSYPSLNLAQAVMVYCYELGQLFLQQEKQAIQAQAPFQALKNKIADLAGDLDIQTTEKLYEWMQDRLNYCDDRDVRMLHLLLKDVYKKL